MMVRQETFKVVPTVIPTSAGRKPPMTSKAAKKAYREASKAPKISKAEQRRLQAEEIARQKREHEKERAAVKAKAAREKKHKKEMEEKEQRRKMGLPEPSKFVRASQTTIKAFVRTVAGVKRMWQDIESVVDEDSNTSDAGTTDLEPVEDGRPRKIVALEEPLEEDDFGDFPSLSQCYLPGLLDDIGPRPELLYGKGDKEGVDSEDFKGSLEKSLESVTPPPRLLQASSPRLPQIRKGEKLSGHIEDEDIPDDEMVKIQLRSEASAAADSSAIERTCISPAADSGTTAMPSSLKPFRCPSALLKPQVRIHDPKSKERRPLGDISTNMAPPPRPLCLQMKPNPSKNTHVAECLTNQSRRPSTISSIPPSNLAFLEANLDDFFPSPSQQVRELLTDFDADEMPSNTQIAREIDDESPAIPSSPPVQAPEESQLHPQDEIDDISLHCLSSQDFELSSQDLRDIDTPSKAPRPLLRQHSSQERDLGCTRPVSNDSTTGQPKRRFFEEKEEDLVHAAIQESLSMATRKPESRPTSKRSVDTDYSDGVFGSDEGMLDAAIQESLLMAEQEEAVARGGYNHKFLGTSQRRIEPERPRQERSILQDWGEWYGSRQREGFAEPLRGSDILRAVAGLPPEYGEPDEPVWCHDGPSPCRWDKAGQVPRRGKGEDLDDEFGFGGDEEDEALLAVLDEAEKGRR